MANKADSHGDDPDSELAIRAAAGDRKAYGYLIRRWQSPLWRTALRYTGDSGEAEDIVQNVFVAFWSRLNNAAAPNNVGAFLRRSTLNACHDWSRRRAVRAFFFRASPVNERVDTQPVTHENEDRETDLTLLETQIAALPNSLKAPLILCGLEGVSHKEAAVILGITPKAVEAKIARAKALLRQNWPHSA